MEYSNRQYDSGKLIELLELYYEESELYRLEIIIIGVLLNRDRLKSIIKKYNLNDICLIGGTVLSDVAIRCFSEYIPVRKIGIIDEEISNFNQFQNFKIDDSLIREIGESSIIVTSLREEEVIMSELSSKIERDRLFRINEMIGW